MRGPFARAWPIVVFGLLLSTVAAAQTTDQGKLGNLLVQLYSDNAVSNYMAFLDVQKTYPTLKVNEDDIYNQIAPAFMFNRQLGSQISSFPLGSSAGGFSWTFSPELGTFKRASESFGPTFAERALTVGKKRFNFGVTYQHASFNNIEGKSLGDKSIKVYTTAALGTATIFIEDALALKVSSDTVGLFGTLGVTDRFDVSFAIPMVHVKMDATLTSAVGSTVQATATPMSGSVNRSGSATGLGDVVMRAKYNVLKAPGGGIAAAVDVRLGTGDEMNFLGLPGSQVKFY